MSEDHEDHEASDARVQKVMELCPADWDKGARMIATEVRNMLKSIIDQGTAIDLGGGDGYADLWATVGGVEYHIGIDLSHFGKATRKAIMGTDGEAEGQ